MDCKHRQLIEEMNSAKRLLKFDAGRKWGKNIHYLNADTKQVMKGSQINKNSVKKNLRNFKQKKTREYSIQNKNDIMMIR